MDNNVWGGAKNFSNAHISTSFVDIRVIGKQGGGVDSCGLSDIIAGLALALYGVSRCAVLPGDSETDSLVYGEVVAGLVDGSLVDGGKLVTTS